MEQFLAQSVVSSYHTAQFLGAKAPKKAPQSVAVRKLWQTQKRRDQTVVDQRLSVLDASNPSYDRKQMSQKEIHRVITSMAVKWPPNLMLKEVPKIERFAKLPKKKQAPVTC